MDGQLKITENAEIAQDTDFSWSPRSGIGLIDLTVVSSAAAIKATGQTISFDKNSDRITDGSLKDDGYYQSGVAHSYHRDESTGIVTDLVTQLDWQDNYSDNNDKIKHLNWQDAIDYCSNLKLDNGGWRLPARNELLSITNYGTQNDSRIFLYKDSNSWSGLWVSSTEFASNNDMVWLVDIFGSGEDMYGDKSDSSVRCVRGNSLPSSNFKRNVKKGTVTDSITGLEWQDNYDDNGGEITTLNFQDAINYCEDSMLGNYSDWRLPNLNELGSLVDDTNGIIAIHSAFQYVKLEGMYISSTTYWPTTSFAWGIVVDDGSIDIAGKGNSNRAVRCVRTTEVSNMEPTANAGADQNILIASSITLDATQSSDSNGMIESYKWEEGDIILSTDAIFTKTDFS
jgi:hypothetical protein